MLDFLPAPLRGVIASLLLALNTGLSWLTLQLGAAYYGYGVALAMMITVFVAMLALESRLHRLEYETFMLQ